MNAATPEGEIDAQRETGAPAPALVLMRTRQEPRAVAGRPGADDASRSAWWRIHGTALMRFAFKLSLGDKNRAEDIVQEPRPRAGRHLELVDGHAETVRPWLFTAARHIAIGQWPARSRHDDVLEDKLTGRPSPVGPIDQAMTAMDVRVALAQLKPEHRQVIVEVFYLGRSLTEIAQLLRIPESTVYSRSYYGLRELKRLLSARPRRRLFGRTQGAGS